MLCPGRSDLCLAPHPDSRVRLADWAIMIAVHAPCRRDICEGVEGGPFSGAGRVGKQVILQLRFRPGGTRRGRGQADLDLAESASSGQGVLGPCCGRIPSAWVRDQVRHCSRLNMLARRPMGTCSWLRVGLEIPRTKIRWVPDLRGPVRISQAAPRERGPPPPLSQLTRFPYPAPAYSRSSSGAQIVGNGQGHGTPFGKNPTPAHAHSAELGLAPRPEGKERSRLKASRNEAWEPVAIRPILW